MGTNYRIFEGTLQDRFQASRYKIQMFCGGFANGKTAGAVIKALRLAKDYPGSNGLIARSTYPKLNDTIRKEFIKWCPDHWIKSFPRSQNASNTCTLSNGTTINFRYIAQQGKSTNEATTSNLLSATYDWIVVDQLEDPEIVHKDFLDLLGRLRGSTKYIGNDETMPASGPRWLIATTNPTRNWVYKKLVRPIHDLKDNHMNEDLLCETDHDGKWVRGKDNKPVPIIEVFEGSTYENKDNLEPDYIATLESSYKGQMRKRFLLGEWAAYEGLVYPDFDDYANVISHDLLLQYYNSLRLENYDIEFLEGFDHGLAVPSCYINGFIDDDNNVILLDGFYDAEIPLDMHILHIKEKRQEYKIPTDNKIYADPDCFRRKSGTKSLVGKSIDAMMLEDGIHLRRGNNDIINGIVKVQQYLIKQRMHINPITGAYDAPHLYISDRLEFVINEFNNYYWKKDSSGDRLDKPTDKDDHAMDTIKYMLTNRPKMSTLIKFKKPKKPGWFRWGECALPDTRTSCRYG